MVGDRRAYRMGGVRVLSRGVDEFTATEVCGGHPLADQVQDREHSRLRGRGGLRLVDEPTESVISRPQVLGHQVVLGREVAVEGRPRYPGLGDQAVHAHGVYPVLVEELGGLCEQALSRVGRHVHQN